jgi:soluble lytic murein transglycosylase-like protein
MAYHRSVSLRRSLLVAIAPMVALASSARTSSVRPVEEWTARFTALVEAGDGAALERELEAIRLERPDLYDRFWLAHLQGRARLLSRDHAGARAAWGPLAAPGHPLRDLALYYLARAAEAEGRVADAARLRVELIALGGPRRSDAQAEQAALLAARRDADGLSAWAERIGSTAPRALRRRINADLVSLWLGRDEKARAIAVASALLRESTGDDPADRVSLAVDRPDLLAMLDGEDRVRVGEAARVHRRFDRAVALLRAGLTEVPQRRDDLLFSIGRAHYVAEDYAAAERAYLDGATTTDAEARARFLYHAARAAQLRGDDRQAEKLLLRTVTEAPRPKARATRGRRASRQRTPAEASRLCLARLQLVRLLASQQRFGAAEPHLAALRAARCPAEAGEAAVAYASAAVVHGRPAAARAQLALMHAGAASEAEGDYWEARALETIDPPRALEAHLALLRPATISPFARFAQARLDGPLARRALERADRLPLEADAARARGDVDAARRLLTDAALLAPPSGAPAARERLRELYRQLPAYANGVALQPLAPPRFSDGTAPNRTEVLLAMGLFDDAADGVGERYAGTSPEMALTRASLLQRGGRARASIRAAEGIVSALPTEFLPELLPGQVRDLLHPRHYFALIQEDALRFGADPLLVLAIMREESRFDTRARSAAAARGLLQIVLTTARAVGKDLGLPELEGEDLYDPALVIPLGSKYLADLQRDFGGNLLKAAAAYNAGPRQAQLWSRLAPGAADDAFFASISFAETRRYVAQVLASYDRYRALTAQPATHTGNGAAGGASRAR